MNEKASPFPSCEGQYVEFKTFLGRISEKELSITLSAFANTEGGKLYIGVTDSGELKGIKVTTELLDHVQNAAREGCIPPVTIALRQISTSAERGVLEVSTPRSSHLHSVQSGHTYIRVGSQDKRVLGDELLRLAEAKSYVSYEEHLIDCGIEAIDGVSLQEYYRARRSVSSLGKSLSPEELLGKLGLATEVDGQFRVRVGALVLFGNADQDVLLQRDFTFVRYEQEGGMYSYREDVRLPAGRTIDRLLEIIRPFNRQTVGIQNLRREEQVLYPEEALREVLLNALGHRDYRIQGLRNECRLYSDRIEVVSVGGLPSFITLENMSRRHYSRNPKIMHALITLGLVEELGQGIQLMRSALKANGNPPPEITATAESVKVIFRSPRLPRGEEDVGKRVMTFFNESKWLTRSQIEAFLGIGTTSAKNLIARLLEENLIIREGKGRATRYRKR